MPDDYPPFPDHGLILKYFENYVDHFGFRKLMTFLNDGQGGAACGFGDWEVTVPTPRETDDDWCRLRRERPPREPGDAPFPRPILGQDCALARLPDAGGVREQTRARRGVGGIRQGEFA